MASVRTRASPPSPTGALRRWRAHCALQLSFRSRHHGGRFVLRIEGYRASDPPKRGSTKSSVWLRIRVGRGSLLPDGQRMDLYRETIERLPRQLDSPTAAYRARPTSSRPGGQGRHAGRQQPGLRPTLPTGLRSGADRRTPGGDPLRGADRGRRSSTISSSGKSRLRYADVDDFVIAARTAGRPTTSWSPSTTRRWRSHGVIAATTCCRARPSRSRSTRRSTRRCRASRTCRRCSAWTARGLSKRHAATAVTSYRELGYYPDALVNFLARLGWSHGDQEVFSRTELIHAFPAKCRQIGGL